MENTGLYGILPYWTLDGIFNYWELDSPREFNYIQWILEVN
jgi:hypothetical protein